MTVLDASALLAFLLDEPGSDEVERALVAGAVCSAANWSEVSQKIIAKQRNWSVVKTLLLSYGLEVAPVTLEDAECAARLWSENSKLWLGDRLCLALSERIEREVLTADTAWGSIHRVRQLR